MNKLKLDVDTLRVDQFHVEPEIMDGEGTVIGHSDTLWMTTQPVRYCPNMPNTRDC